MQTLTLINIFAVPTSCIDIFEFYIEFMSSINCDDEKESGWARNYTANEGLVRIQYKCLVSIYVFQK